MRTLGRLLLGALAGIAAGLLLSELIGIVGFLLFDRAVGIKYLPLVLAPVCAVGAVVRPHHERRPE